MATAELLTIRGLSVEYPPTAERAPLSAVRELDLDLAPGEILGVAGESGSGKTQLLLSILGLNGPRARLSGSIRYRGEQLLGRRPRELNRIRGERISMIFQDPGTALNPYVPIGRQLTEVLRAHRAVSAAVAERRALEMLGAVQIADPAQRLRQYPHQLSGGTRQRVMIAMALMGEPEVLLADEPTTALDVTVQSQILALLRALRERTGIAIVLVTHDMGVIAELADRVAVMYAGELIEQAPVEALFGSPRHPYTEALQLCVPSLEGAPPHRLASIGGAPPEPWKTIAGCPFAPRCGYRLAVCDRQRPALREVAFHHRAACHYQGPLGRLREAPE